MFWEARSNEKTSKKMIGYGVYIIFNEGRIECGTPLDKIV
jgi:hypothetical protein